MEKDLVNLGPTMIRLVRNLKTMDAEIVAWAPMTNRVATFFTIGWESVPSMLQRLADDWTEISQQEPQWIPPWHKEARE